MFVFMLKNLACKELRNDTCAEKILWLFDKLDESTARRQLKSPQSLSGRSIPLVTFEAWSSINMFAFRFVAIGPFLAEI